MKKSKTNSRTAVRSQRTTIRAVGKKSSPPTSARHKTATPVIDLPVAYHDGRFVLLTRDPFWLYCYWDLTPHQQKKLWSSENPALRLVEVVDHEQERELKRFALSRGARSWYIQVDTSNKVFRAELGHVDNHGQFLPVISSNVTTTPRETVSPNIETQFATVTPPPPHATTSGAATSHGTVPRAPSASAASSRATSSLGAAASPGHRPRPYPAPALQPVSPATAERFFQHSAGVRSKHVQSSNSAEALWEQQERLGPQLFSEVLLSAALGGEKFFPGSIPPEKAPAAEKEYWLTVDADLIVYGATVPGSRVTILKAPVTVDAEGHFSARFTLPDGLRDIHIEGASPEQKSLKGARIRVERATSHW
jgi:hypothetical protein